MRSNPRLSRAFVGVLALFAAVIGVAIGAHGPAAADALPPPPECEPWQTVRMRRSAHGGGECVPRTCSTDSQCRGGRCASRRACLVTRTRWQSSPGPCIDRNGDGECDGRRRITETVEAERCDADGRCIQGRCTTIRECTPPSG